jgi:hypothetical protein
MADKNSERARDENDPVVNRDSTDERVRGIADDETDAEFEDSEDLDEEDEAEDEEGGSF